MNRRFFMKTAGATGAVLMVDGCSGTVILDFINTALQAAENVIAVAEPGATWVADFQQAINALKSAETTWSSGGAVQIVIDALNTLEAVTAVIPFTAVYSPLIDILVAGIEALLELLPHSSNAKIVANGHMGRVVLNKPHVFQSRVGAFKSQWNDAVKSNAALAGAKL